MQTVKYDPEAWVHQAKDKSLPCGQEVHIRLLGPGTVSVDLGDGKHAVAYGQEMKISLPRPGKIYADVPFMVHAGVETAVQSMGAPLTNMDKRPGQSSAELIIARQFRERDLKARLAAEERRRADWEHQQRRIEAGLQDEENTAPPPPPPEEEEAVTEAPDQAQPAEKSA